MATFYAGSTNQRDVMTYLRDSGQTPYPESSVPANMLYFNYSSPGSYSETLTGSTQSQQNCIELPAPTSVLSPNSSDGGADLVSSRLGEHAYNAWRDGRSEMLFMQPIGSSGNGPDDLLRSSVTDDPRMGLHSHLGILNGHNFTSHQSDVSNIQGQGLSLSLSTEIPVPSLQYMPGCSDISFMSSHQSTSGNGGKCRDDNYRSKLNLISSPCVVSNVASSIPNSKYLKAAQQLLDGVVSVRKALKHKTDKSQASSGTMECKEKDNGSKPDGITSNTQESTTNSGSELSPSARQELQNKVSKLLAMLDEVDRRYKQYYHQILIVVSSFDAIAGCGAAKSYTSLALQTISQHFRCLRDAICGQIRVTQKSLGEQDCTSCKGVGISRLRYIDQHLRQQKVLQQFGMMQPHAWRPQRGLPETSVSVLRAWLFEHFLHPYPKDSEKSMLAREAGLTRSQVSNWFINARVRLWKPMIEEMYKEEKAEMDSNSSSENAPKGREGIRYSGDGEDLHSPTAETCHTSQFIDSSKSVLIQMGSTSASGFQNEDNVDHSCMNIKPREQRPNVEDYGLLQDALGHADGSGRFMAYQMAELGRYGKSGVSLTLGLQHCDGSFPGSNGQQSFLGIREEENCSSAPNLGEDATDYDYMNMGSRQQGFSSSQLLHDFVA